MFIVVRKVNRHVIPSNNLLNPVTPENTMTLDIYQQEVATFFMRSIVKKRNVDYVDTKKGRIIPKRKWTEEMQRFFENQTMHLPPAVRKFKITVGGYIFIALFAFFIGYLIYEELRPKKQVVFDNLGETVKAGDIYYGRFSQSTPAGVPIRNGYAWFKVKEVQGDTVLINLGKQTTTEYGQDELLSSTEFADSTYKTTIREQKKSSIDFRTKNSEMMFDASKRK